MAGTHPTCRWLERRYRQQLVDVHDQPQPLPITINDMSLDILTLEIMPTKFLNVVEIKINGLSLLDMILEVERPFAKNMYSNLDYHSYSRLREDMVFSPSQHLLGEAVPSEDDYPSCIPIFTCIACGAAICDCILIKIEIHETTIEWRNCHNPRRKKSHPNPKRQWDYSPIPNFTFDRSQYEAALAGDSRYVTRIVE